MRALIIRVNCSRDSVRPLADVLHEVGYQERLRRLVEEDDFPDEPIAADQNLFELSPPGIRRLVGEDPIEVEIGPGRNVNDLFARLGEQGITVLSMRNKANRLEELFLRLVEQGALKGEQGA